MIVSIMSLMRNCQKILKDCRLKLPKRYENRDIDQSNRTRIEGQADYTSKIGESWAHQRTDWNQDWKD